jgi:hypothetical protein
MSTFTQLGLLGLRLIGAGAMAAARKQAQEAKPPLKKGAHGKVRGCPACDAKDRQARAAQFVHDVQIIAGTRQPPRRAPRGVKRAE